MEGLEQAIAAVGDVKLIVIDPISAYLGGKLDSHRNTDVRAALAPLQDVAARHDLAVLAISHLSKTGTGAITRVMGSMAFAAAARAVYIVGEEPSEDDEGPPTTGRRLFVPLKNNLGRNDRSGLAFTIEERQVSEPSAPAICAPAIVWSDEEITTTADELVDGSRRREGGSPRTIDDDGSHKRGVAKKWLLEALQAGPRYSNDLVKEVKHLGISERTLFRAQRELGIRRDKCNTTERESGSGSCCRTPYRSESATSRYLAAWQPGSLAAWQPGCRFCC